MVKLKIQEEIIEPNFSDDKRMLHELKEHLVKEHEEKEKKVKYTQMLEQVKERLSALS